MSYNPYYFDPNGEWDYSTYYDDEYRPPGSDYGGGDYQDNGSYNGTPDLPRNDAFDPYGMNLTPWAGYFQTPDGTQGDYFRTSGVQLNPWDTPVTADPSGKTGWVQKDPKETWPPITDPKPVTGTNPSSGGTTNNNNQTNNSFALSNTALSSNTNAMPPIAQGSPEANPAAMADPQTIPQGQRQMNPAGMDSSRHSPYFGPPPPEQSPYEPGLSRAGNGIPSGNEQPIATTPQPSWKSAATGVLKGLTGIDVTSPKAAGDSLLGLTGVNRYRGLIRDTRKRPNDPNQAKSPYDSGTY